MSTADSTPRARPSVAWWKFSWEVVPGRMVCQGNPSETLPGVPWCKRWMRRGTATRRRKTPAN